MQPSGTAHLGNYLGALRQWAAIKATPQQDVFFCAVDLHALSLMAQASAVQHQHQQSSRLGGKFVVLPDLLRNVRRFVATLLACGVDGSSAVIYRQSAVPAHSELHWLLSCVTPLGRLQRMTQFKDKSAASAAAQDAADPPLALLAYPVLMAADILLFNATHVPVGDDQRQHLELCNAVARAFNHVAREEVFVEPHALGIDAPTARVMSLADPTVKMSKSAPLERSRIHLTDSADEIASKIRRAVTDTDARILYDRTARPGVANLLDICADLRSTPVEQLLAERRFDSASALKQYTIDTLVEHIVPIGKRIAELEGENSTTIDTVLADGAQRARKHADRQLQKVKSIIGL
jgi:tryptophanyl-tRNA synthetase